MERPNANYADQTEPKQEINIEEGSIIILSSKRLRETIARQSKQEICAVNVCKHKFDIDIEDYNVARKAAKESRLRLYCISSSSIISTRPECNKLTSPGLV